MTKDDVLKMLGQLDRRLATIRNEALETREQRNTRWTDSTSSARTSNGSGGAPPARRATVYPPPPAKRAEWAGTRPSAEMI